MVIELSGVQLFKKPCQHLHIQLTVYIHSLAWRSECFTVRFNITSWRKTDFLTVSLRLRWRLTLRYADSQSVAAHSSGSNYIISTKTMWNLFFIHDVEITLKLFFWSLEKVGMKRTRTRITGQQSGNHIHKPPMSLSQILDFFDYWEILTLI